jgi:predicted Ser/Thr protein kinase
MSQPSYSLAGGETLLKEAGNSHFLRPAASLVGRLCHPYLTERRLIICEAYYDFAGMRERGVGGVLHEIALAGIEKLKSSPDSVEPYIELDSRNQSKELEKLVLFFRDDGWTVGAPERLAERDEWIAAIGLERERMGLPLEIVKPQAPAVPSPPAAPKTPGGDLKRVLAGKYQILSHIGSGGMGIVYEGKDLTLERSVAVKKMRSDVKISGRDRELFFQEAKTSALLHHPFIVDIYAIAEEGEEIFLVFEYVDGKTLQEYLDDKRRMPPEKTKQVLKCVCEALAYAHSCKVVHRDIKPSNIMITKQGYAKVMDFGISRRIKDTASRLSATKLDSSGTLPYMAPEQERGKGDQRADIFALGVTAYELLSGEMAFLGPNFYLQKEKKDFKPLAEISPDVPAELALAVERCMSFNAEDRFPTVEEFASAAGIR